MTLLFQNATPVQAKVSPTRTVLEGLVFTAEVGIVPTARIRAGPERQPNSCMSKNTAILIALAALLGGVYVYFFTDTFSTPTIRISAQIRPGRGATTAPVTFGFNDKYALTSVKVVSSDDFRTNKYAHALWHLIADTNSTPVKGIIYGVRIPGMKPAVPKMKPEPLQPNVSYVLLVEAGKRKGEKTFQTRELIRPATQ
jgi:hypothetical protein